MQLIRLLPAQWAQAYVHSAKLSDHCAQLYQSIIIISLFSSPPPDNL